MKESFDHVRMLLIDNYDSFTYNLVQYLGQLGADVVVHRNDQITVDEIRQLRPRHIMISPGPGNPDDAGVSMDVIRTFAGSIPILGVCLGHQCIAQVYGGEIVSAGEIMHGKLSDVHHGDAGVFAGLETPLQATRYHSLVVSRDSLPDCLEVTAWTLDAQGEVEEIMGLRHRSLAVEGVQFHPESIMSDHGHAMLRQFLAVHT